jgi:uncharacterized protein
MMETVANQVDHRKWTLSSMGWIAFILLVIGGINWGLVGLFQFDVVAELLGGQDSPAARVVYVLVGLSALYCLFELPAKQRRISRQRA